ncbi:hypothetical protein SEUCBS140593_005350 [Sporothrix eucalyptigena]|uniref:FluG domain-containing protein n=1 Tax=Sporothrix eucalyptigena TaxID=1812306 RepID=A0ABP0BW20_9PEZI
MARQSLDAGFEKPIEPKVWRRGAGNAANGKAPDATRDQMMRHDPKWATFNSAYINERVKFHLQNAVLDEPYEDALLSMLSHMSALRDPRARSDMVPDEVWRDLPPDPEIVRLQEERAKLKKGQYRIKGRKEEQKVRDLTKTIRTKLAQRDKAIQKTYRQYYFYQRPTWDIERQARGELQEEYSEPVIEYRIPERARLAELFSGQSDDLNPAELTQRRIEAGELMAALCQKRDTVKLRRIHQKSHNTAHSEEEESPRPDPFPLLMGKTQCPRCVGDERQTYQERIFSYCRSSVMNDHFDHQHLKEMEEMERSHLVFCDHPKCKEEGVKLKDLDHFRNHVQKVHGITLRPRRSG